MFINKWRNAALFTFQNEQRELPIKFKSNFCLCYFFFLLAGRTAFLGLGFGDRSDSFDLNVALQDHFKWVKNQEKIDQEKVTPRPELDLGFKEGETIKINMKITVSHRNRKQKQGQR